MYVFAKSAEVAGPEEVHIVLCCSLGHDRVHKQEDPSSNQSKQLLITSRCSLSQTPPSVVHYINRSFQKGHVQISKVCWDATDSLLKLLARLAFAGFSLN